MKRILPFLKPYRKEAVISPLFKLLEAVFDLLVPIIVKQIIDTGIVDGGGDSYILGRFGILLALAAIGLSCAVVAQYFAAKAAVGFSTDLRSALFSKIQGLSFTQTDRIGTPTLITRMTADVNQVQSGLNLALRLLLRSPIIVLGAMIMAFTVNAKSAVVFAVIIPLLALVVFSIMLRTIPLYRGVQKKLDRVTGLTRETLTGVRVIRAFCKEAEETERFDDANRAHTRAQIFVGRVSALMNPLTLVLVNAGTILLLWSGARLVEIGGMTQGDVVAMTNYMAQILVELVKFANTVFSVNKALASAHRIEAVLELPEDLTRTPESGVVSNAAVEFRDVSLTYAENAAPSLSHLTFSVPRGATVGIIGSTGSGKSSLAHLISRFYDATDGQVLVGGRDVREQDTVSLRERIAVVPQRAVLFRGTIRSNLLWGAEDATDKDLWQALERAQAKEFVKELPCGLDAPVEQGGKNFSGGQRQRLTIARALVRKRADILIFDDSSSALDYATDANLRAALKTLDGDPTIFLISQRTASIRHADLILVLEDGELVGSGTHETLLDTCPVYREIYDSQFRKGGETA